MRLRSVNNRVRGKAYRRYVMDLSKEEGQRISRVAAEWEIDDIDPKGYLMFRAKGAGDATSMTNCTANLVDHRTTIRFKMARGDWARLRSLLAEQGLTLCHAFSGVAQGMLAARDSLPDHPYIVIQNVFQGVPRSRSERLVGRRELI